MGFCLAPVFRLGPGAFRPAAELATRAARLRRWQATPVGTPPLVLAQVQARDVGVSSFASPLEGKHGLGQLTGCTFAQPECSGSWLS
eukprot:724953-Prymnesium_polylepis.1